MRSELWESTLTSPCCRTSGNPFSPGHNSTSDTAPLHQATDLVSGPSSRDQTDQTVVIMLKKYVDSKQNYKCVNSPLVTGQQLTVPLHLLYQPGNTKLIIAYLVSPQQLRTLFTFTQENLQKSDDQKTSQAQFQLGDKIWYYTFMQLTGKTQNSSQWLSRKLLPHWSGSCKDEDKLLHVAYQIKTNWDLQEPTFKLGKCPVDWIYRTSCCSWYHTYATTVTKDDCNPSWVKRVQPLL